MQITALLIIVTTLVVPFHICKSQTHECNVINQYYGSEFKELALNFDNERPKNNGHRGEPGKRGPKGGRGMPGQKGEPSVIHEKTKEKVTENEQAIYYISKSLSDHIVSTNQTFEHVKVNLAKKASQEDIVLLSETIVELVQTNAKLRKKFVQFQTFMNETITSTTSKQSFSSCIEATNSNKDLDYYLIDIGSKKSIPVKCKTSNGIVYATIGHNIEDEIAVTGYEKPGDYKRIIDYKTSLQDVRAFIDRHTNCRQFIKYRCRGSLLLRNGHSYWKSYDGNIRRYWGGSNRDNYCGCGIAGNCINRSFKCNCDQNSDDMLTSDEGYLTNKDHLPVIEVSFSDTGAENEIGWHTLGPLECW